MGHGHALPRTYNGMCKKQALDGRFFVFEHPAGASSWEQACVQEVMALPGVQRVLIDMCRFGFVSKGARKPMRKRTYILTNAPPVVKALQGCLCDRSHEHQVVQGMEGGGRCSVRAQVYPVAFCKVLAQCALECREKRN